MIQRATRRDKPVRRGLGPETGTETRDPWPVFRTAVYFLDGGQRGHFPPGCRGSGRTGSVFLLRFMETTIHWEVFMHSTEASESDFPEG